MDKKTEISARLQAFVDIRGRPAIFLLIPSEELLWGHAFAIRAALKNKSFEELDLVIHSTGGYGDIAYLIIQMLRLHAKKINACIPLWAKSAATLLCIGADAIVMDELAQLGPLDPQIYIGGGELASALNAFKNLEELTTFAENTLQDATAILVEATELDLDACIERAIDFVRVVSGPLFTKLDLQNLGEYSRALSVSKEYGKRLLTRLPRWNAEQAEKVISKLVYGYPSHSYVLDFYELVQLGFEVELFTEAERTAVEALFDLCLTGEDTKINPDSTIQLIEPSKHLDIPIRSPESLPKTPNVLYTPTAKNSDSQSLS